jgi:hypothetical protein
MHYRASQETFVRPVFATGDGASPADGRPTIADIGAALAKNAHRSIRSAGEAEQQKCGPATCRSARGRWRCRIRAQRVQLFRKPRERWASAPVRCTWARPPHPAPARARPNAAGITKAHAVNGTTSIIGRWVVSLRAPAYDVGVGLPRSLYPRFGEWIVGRPAHESSESRHARRAARQAALRRRARRRASRLRSTMARLRGLLARD